MNRHRVAHPDAGVMAEDILTGLNTFRGADVGRYVAPYTRTQYRVGSALQTALYERTGDLLDLDIATAVALVVGESFLELMRGLR